MKAWIRTTALGATMLATVAGLTVLGALARADSLQGRVLALPAQPLQVPVAAGDVARGRYLYQSRGCADCHGSAGQGQRFIDDPKLGMRVAGPSLAPGRGSVVAAYRDADWERALRHGVKPDGRPLMVMPSEDFNRWTDADVAAVAAFVRQLPAQDVRPAELGLPLPFRVLYGLGLVQDAAARIDHGLPPQQPVAEGVTLDHGAYVANSCKGCHGATLAGGRIPGAPPDWPAAARLAPGDGSAMPAYASAEEFKAMLRSGRRPDGKPVSPVMPFAALGQLNDVDAEALYLYLRQMPAKAGG